MRRITVLFALCLLATAAFGYGDTVWLRTYDPAASSGAPRTCTASRCWYRCPPAKLHTPSG